jgi:hypothetical protein
VSIFGRKVHTPSLEDATEWSRTYVGTLVPAASVRIRDHRCQDPCVHGRVPGACDGHLPQPT